MAKSKKATSKKASSKKATTKKKVAKAAPAVAAAAPEAPAKPKVDRGLSPAQQKTQAFLAARKKYKEDQQAHFLKRFPRKSKP